MRNETPVCQWSVGGLLVCQLVAMHIGLGPKPFILATSVFNYADAFDGDLSAWDVSVVIYSARLKSIVYIG